MPAQRLSEARDRKIVGWKNEVAKIPESDHLVCQGEGLLTSLLETEDGQELVGRAKIVDLAEPGRDRPEPRLNVIEQGFEDGIDAIRAQSISRSSR